MFGAVEYNYIIMPFGLFSGLGAFIKLIKQTKKVIW